MEFSESESWCIILYIHLLTYSPLLLNMFQQIWRLGNGQLHQLQECSDSFAVASANDVCAAVLAEYLSGVLEHTSESLWLYLYPDCSSEE